MDLDKLETQLTEMKNKHTNPFSPTSHNTVINSGYNTEQQKILQKN